MNFLRAGTAAAVLVASVFGTADPLAPGSGMAFAESANGAAVVAWAGSDGSVRAATRSGGVWSEPQRIVAGSACDVDPDICTAPVAAAIDDAGHAAVGFRRYDANRTTSTVYVSND